MIWALAFAFLGLVYYALKLIDRRLARDRMWESGALCPLCERPWSECPGCKPVYLRPSPLSCNCTDGGRYYPLTNCPECKGTGELK